MRSKLLLPLIALFGIGLLLSLGGDGAKAQAQAQGAICMYYDQTGPGDLSFNDVSRMGATQAATEFNLKVTDTVASGSASYLPDLQGMARSGQCLIIIGVGFLLADALPEAAGNVPDQKFAFVDGTGKGVKNVLGLLFREQEGGAPVGAIAALMAINAGDTLIGAVGGMEIPPVWHYEAGYRFGAHWAVSWYKQHTGKDAQITVNMPYVGRFDDPAGGKTTAQALLQAGARNLFGVAGGSHLGMFDAVEEAARAAGRDMGPPFAYGADTAQEYIKPGFILASANKRVNAGTYEAVRRAVQGGTFGTDIVLGIKDGATGLSSLQDIENFINFAQNAGYKLEGTPAQVEAKILQARDSVPYWVWQGAGELMGLISAGAIQLPQADTSDQIGQVRKDYP